MFNFFSIRPTGKKGKRSGEKGQALVLVLCLVALGSLLLTALLGMMGSGAKTSRVYHRQTSELYSADAGIQDANWQIKYDKLTGFTAPSNYNAYDYTTEWPDPGVVSDNTITPVVTIKNQWAIPTSIIPQPGTAEANTIAGQTKLVVNGTTTPGKLANDGITHISLYTLTISYNSGSETTSHLNVDSIGVWIPQGCTYFSDGHANSESTFQLLSASSPWHLDPPSETLWANGTVKNWDFTANPQFTTFPTEPVTLPAVPRYSLTTTGSENVLTAQFYFKPPSDNLSLKPNIIAWIKTTNGTSCGLSYNYAWNSDIKLYKMKSYAKDPTNTGNGTTVEAYTTKAELRDLDSALNGDYYASGKSLMLPTFPVENHRDTLLMQSTKDFDNTTTIPDNAKVQLAYLYWSGWVGNVANGVWWDNCGNLTSTDPSYCKFNASGTWTVDDSHTSYNVSDNNYYERFKGHGNGSSLTSKANIDLSITVIPATATATIYWDQASDAAFRDFCTSTNFSNNWQNGGDWNFNNSSPYTYRGQHNPSTGAASKRDLTSNAINLSSYGSTASIGVSWTVTKGSSTANGDGLNFAYSLNGGTSWTTSTIFLQGTSNTPTAGMTIPSGTLPGNFKIKFTLVGYGSSNGNRYCDIDNITISVNSTSQLLFELSNDGGTTWSSDFTALTGQNPPPEVGQGWMPTYHYTLPRTGTSYYSAQFRIKFKLSGYNGTNDNVYIDNLLITDDSITAREDRNITFTIQKHGYSPVTTKLTANPATDMVWSDDCISGGTTHDGYYYACRVDVTDLVKSNTDGVNLALTPKLYGNGKSIYTVGDVYTDNKCVMTPGELCTSSYAGWSLLIVYSSADTKGHQLYLYENPTSVSSGGSGPHGSNQIDQQSAGFLVPAQITGETEAGKITVFVGEGDMHNFDNNYNLEYVSYFPQGSTTDTQLWDGVDCSNTGMPNSSHTDGNYGNTSGNPNNPWNGFSGDSNNPFTVSSSSASESGIDVDTFHISWGSHLLHEGDTSGTIRLSTNGDGFTVIYKIFSFRSKTTTGGSIGYLIKN